MVDGWRAQMLARGPRDGCGHRNPRCRGAESSVRVSPPHRRRSRWSVICVQAPVVVRDPLQERCR
jgi:hypothetical protein